MSDEPPFEVHEMEHRNAERAHDRSDAVSDTTNAAAVASGQVALRAALLINGGAAVAMLAFIGSIASLDGLGGDHLAEMASSLVWFAWGVTAAVIGMAFAYFTNYFASEQLGSRKKIWEYPYLEDVASTKRWWWVRVVSQSFAVLAGLTSVGLFVWGMLDVEATIGLLNAPQS